MKLTFSSLAISMLALAGYGCGSGAPVPPPAAPLSSPVALCTDASSNCVEPAHVERWLRREPLEILGVAETSGSSGAKLLTLARNVSGVRRVFRAKWREHEGSLLNDARKEIVAYRTQQLFLLPHEYVVPPTTGRCLDLKTYRAHLDREAEASFEGTSCVFGSLSYWLENVKGSEPFSRDRFEQDVEYRRAMADVNTFTFVIQHGDTHDKNFLMTKEEDSAQARVYSPDNAIAFSPYFRNPMELFRSNWYDLRVPALRAAVVDRLSHVERKDVEALSVVEQYRIEQGALIPTKPGAPIDESAVRLAGKTLQIGLTPEESERLFERVQLLLSKVRSGEIEVF